MDKLDVYVGDQLAGSLSRTGERHRFDYPPAYDGPPVFLGWSLVQQSREWDHFPPAFDSLLPEGVLLDQLLRKHKLDKADKWGQLIAVGQDLTGFVSVLPAGSTEKLLGKVVPGQKARKRVAIHPDEHSMPYTIAELVSYHGKHKLRMSLSGVQPKVSAVFSRKENAFKIVETGGSYILKPSPQAFPGTAEIEAVTMELASQVGIAVPLCGWLPAKDGAGVFWIERFDRWGPANRSRLRCEDACQILEVPASWKYAGNLEALVRMIREHCSNPRLQLIKFFQRVLFCWVTGNGDMHLKNWSLIENGPLIELAPAYDLLSTRLLLDDEEDSALTLDGRKSGFDRQLLVDYLGREVCGINDRMIEKTLHSLTAIDWHLTLLGSKLEAESAHAYLRIIEQRLSLLGLK
jgi:serine/threonine-protein kinase HipA